MKGFAQLFKKDMESIGLMTVLLGVGIVLWDVFLYTRLGLWHSRAVVALTMVPLGVIVLWVVLQAIQVYRHEWQTGGIYLVLSVPQPGWKIALSKLAVVFASFTIHLILATVGFIWVLRASASYSGGIQLFGLAAEALFQSGAATGWLFKMTLVSGFAYWLMGLAMALMLQLAYTCSRLTSRLRLLAGLAGFFVIEWLVGLCGAAGYYVFSWVPDLVLWVPVHALGITDPAHSMASLPVQGAKVFIDSGILLGNALGFVLLFITTSYLLENVIEV